MKRASENQLPDSIIAGCVTCCIEPTIMTLIHTAKEGWIVSHLQYLNDIYKSVQNDSTMCKLMFNKMFFEINSQYLRQNQVPLQNDGESLQSKSRKRKRTKQLPQEHLSEMNYVKEAFNKILATAKEEGLFCSNAKPDNNETARLISQKFYQETFQSEEENFFGCNETDSAIISMVQNRRCVFPERCWFYCYDVRDIEKKIELKNQYDFILLDPPWWNKSIRRKKSKYVEASYKMMYNEELVRIPIGKLLRSNGIVAIWCTNAPTHLHSIFHEMFPSWGVTYRAKWYWVKVTQMGSTICNFNTAPGKQPYELLVLGSNEVNIPDNKLLVSVPSAVHSHKPPLIEVIKDYLPSEPKCLEIFARYLLPGWTSWGLEVLKFQQLSLYTIAEDANDGSTKE